MAKQTFPVEACRRKLEWQWGRKEQAVEPGTQQMEKFKQFKSSVQMTHVDVEAAGMSHPHSWAAFVARTRTPLIILVAC